MGYLGQQASFTGTQNNKRISVIADAGQVNFLPSGGYNINAIDVYRNGVKLVGQRDFVALDGITVTLTTPANGLDTIEFVIYENFVVADVLNGDGDQVISGNLQVSGDLSIGGILNATVQSTVKAGIATEAVRAGMSTEATRAGIATEAVSAGIATYAVRAGYSTEAIRAGIATEAVRAGIASVAVSAGIATQATQATYAVVAGVSTYVSGYLGVGVTGTNLNVTGIITASSFSGDGSQLTGIAVTENVRTSTLVVAGMSTFSGNVSVAGISTFNTASGVGTVSVGIGTTALLVDGNTRIIGILTVGSSSVSIYPSTNTVQVGSAITLRGDASQLQVGSGVTISGTHLSIAGIMTVGSIGAAIGKNAIGNRTVQSGGSPSGGSDGDIYYIY
jgi:hypothetical protein